MQTRFYICRHCGNVIEKVHDAGVPVVCCGEKMEALVPNTVEASEEKAQWPYRGVSDISCLDIGRG